MVLDILGLFRKEKRETASTIVVDNREQLKETQKESYYERVITDAMDEAERLYWLGRDEQFCDI